MHKKKMFFGSSSLTKLGHVYAEGTQALSYRRARFRDSGRYFQHHRLHHRHTVCFFSLVGWVGGWL